MKLTLGRRIGLLQSVLPFTKTAWTLAKCAEALEALDDPNLGQLSPDVLSKIFNANTNDRFDGAEAPEKIIEIVISLLAEGGDLFERFQTSADEMARQLQGDEVDFIRYLGRLAGFGRNRPDRNRRPEEVGDLPVLPGIDKIHRDETVKLLKALGGHCFMYRLGVDKRTGVSKNGNPATEHIPVLRRIPARIKDTESNYLLYEDSYSLYGEIPEDDRAAGYIFYTKENFTVVAEDYDSRGVSELFLLQLRHTKIPRLPADVYEGLMVMNGDSGAPTACKVLFRRASSELQELPWEKFVELYELKVDLRRDDIGLSVDGEEAVELDQLSYHFFVDRLQIEARLPDITLA